MNPRAFKKITLTILFTVLTAYAFFGIWSTYVIISKERLGQIVQVGESAYQVSNKLSLEFVAEEAPLEVIKYRFEDDELQALADSGAKLIVYSYPDGDGPFFFLIFDTNDVLIHKFVPGAN